MKYLQIILISFVILFFSIAEGFAFRCGPGLVTTGDTKMQVSVTCGNPTSKDIICARKTLNCPNIVEIWFYNCGAADYIYALTFEDGKLVKETTEGSGKGRSDCQGK